VETGPWDLARAGTPGRHRLLASDADRERAVDLLKAAFVQGALTKDELDARTGAALAARTYGQLAALIPGPRETRPREAAGPREAAARPRGTKAPATRRVSKKAVAWGACAIVLSPALAAAFFTYYGGFLVIFVFTLIASVVCSTPPAPRRPRPPG
jgi:DUF1707 SHOCT-like domain